MYAVKREFGEEICRGCFSTDRRLSPLANYNLYFSLLDDKQKLEALKSPAMQLCWECNASLRRLKLFQTQVQQAHRLLHELVELEGQLPAEGLSQLHVCYKQDYDVIIEDDLDDIEEQLIIPVKEETKLVFNENLNPDDDHTFEDTDTLETHTELDLFVETMENSIVETIPRKKYKLKKGNRPGLRSSRDIIRPLYPNRNNGNKNDVKKTKIRVGNTLKRKIKQSNRKRCLNRKDPIQNVKVKKENQTPDVGDTAAKDLQNEVTNDDGAEGSADLELGNVKDQNTKEKIEVDIHNIEQENHSDESDSENDNNDPDFEEKDELDEYFTKVDLGPEEVKHILDNELSYVSEEQPYGCNYCGMCFQMHKTLAIHKRNRHKQIARCTNPVYLMYRCNICHKIVRQEHTEAHMKYLHRRRYSCKECDKEFWNIEEGRSHFMESHKQKRSCNLCAHISSTTKALEAHVRQRHTPVPCDICGKKTSGTERLKLHRRRHQTDDSTPEQCYCVPCDKQLPSVYAYEQHLKKSSVHSGKTPRIPCTKCGKLMADKNSLQLHYDRFHSDKTKFQCPQCDKYYGRSCGLRMHIDSVHLKKKLPKDKLCSMCGRGFSHSRVLKFHMRTHTGERPHVCPHCPAAFAQPYPLRKHLASQHGEAPAALNKEAPTTQA
ncbi:hypothetical protein MSG28_015884 [Choristoneura fumiferana]|uniref:Uncharacterized protein n=1 Tax=Choristoneura fumiferana TaxID=7141 RepID=A0ACC0K4I6_CHOFU|nr:hypothetical protein MSG28_015884 [Choristoneura fumiferana]